MELTEKKSGKGPAKQDSFKELREDKLLGVDQRDKGYKELLKQEVALHANVEQTEYEKRLVQQLLARQATGAEGPEAPLQHAMTGEMTAIQQKAQAFKPIQDLLRRGKHRGKVKITIRQQAPGGQMVALPLPTDSKGRQIAAAFHVDKKDYDPAATGARDQLLELLNKVHTTNTRQAQPVDLAQVQMLTQGRGGGITGTGETSQVLEIMERTA